MITNNVCVAVSVIVIHVNGSCMSCRPNRGNRGWSSSVLPDRPGHVAGASQRLATVERLDSREGSRLSGWPAQGWSDYEDFRRRWWSQLVHAHPPGILQLQVSACRCPLLLLLLLFWHWCTTPASLVCHFTLNILAPSSPVSLSFALLHRYTLPLRWVRLQSLCAC